MNLVFGIIVGFLVLTTLVVLHELGHFFMAKKNGVKVNEFGIGFPPRAIAWIHLPKDQVEDFIKNLPEEEQSKLPLAKIRQKLEKNTKSNYLWVRFPKSEYEKSFENLGFKAPIASTTNFSPQVNIETDKNKILETKKEDIPTISPIINLKNDKDKFINNKILNPQVKDVSNKKEEPKKEIIKTATPSYDKLTSKLISAFEEQRKNVKTVVENKTLNYIAKPSEKIRVPEVKQGNNDIKVPPQNVTFSPQINLNMGGVVIKNEADVEKVAELSKQKIIKNLMTYVQTTN